MTKIANIEKRDIGVDLLRILLALMVVGIHFNARATGGVAVAVSESPFNYIVTLMVALCYPAVNTYVIISGYYSYKLKKNWGGVLRSLIKLWFCLLFFSIFGYIIVAILDYRSFSIADFIYRFLPLSRGVWWFMSHYTVLMLLSPMINIVIDSYSNKQNIIVVLVALLICSVIPFFLKWQDTIGLNNGYGVLWFIVLYYTGAVLNINLNALKQNSMFYLCCFVGITALFIIINSFLGHINLLNGYHVSMYNSLIVYLQAITLFVAFKKITFKNRNLSKIIAFLSGLSLAVYIFHCQEDISPFIWTLLQPSKLANSWNIIPLFIVTVIGVYILSISIEFVREKFFAQLENRFINQLFTHTFFLNKNN